MIAVLQNPEVGKLYKFVYKNKPRVALCLDNSDSLMRSWDFTRGDFRQFYHDKMGPVTDISDKMTVLDEPNYTDLDSYEDAGCSVYLDEYNDKAYCVRIKNND